MLASLSSSGASTISKMQNRMLRDFCCCFGLCVVLADFRSDLANLRGIPLKNKCINK